MTTTTTIEILNDLIESNYDRIEGYRKAAEESKDFVESLHPLFMSKADESRKHVSALVEKVRAMGGIVYVPALSVCEHCDVLSPHQHARIAS